MSLRIRLAILCAALAVFTATTFGVVSYESTSNRMTAQVDASLRSAAAYLTGAAANYEPEGNADEGGRPPWIDPGPGGPGGILDQVAVQHLDVTGLILTLHAGPTLPVDELDKQVASGALREVLRTVTVSGVAFRLITVGVAGGGAVQVAQSLGQRTVVLHGLQLQLLVLGFLVALLGAAAGWLIALRLTEPLEALTTATEDLATTGTTTLPPTKRARDEVGRLTSSFASMLATLESSRAQQHQLVRDAGHELRTPITSLRTNIELLERHGDQLSASQRTELLSNLGAELAELTTLVDEIVEVATDGVSDEAPEELVLADLAERVAVAVNRRHGTTITVGGDRSVVEAPPRALERAVSNLLENAVKFAGLSATITCTVEEGRLAVTDDGPGVASADLARIFDRFYRAESSKSTPGSGLGLAIVASVVDANGGRTFAEPRPGGGLTVGFTLPTT